MMTRSRVIFADEISWLSCGNSPGLDNHVDDQFRSILSSIPSFLPSLSFFIFSNRREKRREMRCNKFVIISREISDVCTRYKKKLYISFVRGDKSYVF